MIFPYENKFIKTLCQSLAILGLILYIVYIFWYHPFYNSSITIITTKIAQPTKNPNYSSTNITHVVFGLSGTTNSWNTKKHYIESWWRPNKTRGLLFLDRPPPSPWPATSPPYRVSQDTTRYQMYNKHKLKHAIRMTRVVEEIFNMVNNSVRWYVMTDDDTIIFVDNLVEVLGKYDHREYWYIGMNSESIASNVLFSFGMAFGGGGYALSFPLAKALAMNLDVCIKTYPSLYGSDHILQSCIADLGVSLTQERGFHQIDLHRDIFGFLSALPQTPLLSLHHLDVVEPIFPAMNRTESFAHLMKAAKKDSSRLLQQSFCYSNSNNWTFSISWGYSIQIYEAIYPPSVLQRPLETFRPWAKWANPPYMFNTRFPSKNPCEAPHILFFDNVDEMKGNYVVTSYSRRWPRRLIACPSSGNHSADYISFVKVLSPMRRREAGVGSRRECCDIVQMSGMMNTTRLKLRPCMKNEIEPSM